MRLIVNGDNLTFDDNSSIKDILVKLGVESKVMACAVNMEIIKKDNWNDFIPKDDDTIELLHFVGGG